jgi:hypothetical protein
MESYWLRVEQADRDRAFHEAAVAQRRGAVSSLLELGHISSKGYARALAVLLNNTSAVCSLYTITLIYMSLALFAAWKKLFLWEHLQHS